VSAANDNAPKVPATDGRWWLDEQEEHRGDRIMQAAQRIWHQCEPARAAMLSAWRLYSNQPLVGSGTQPRMYRRRTLGTVGATSLSLNVVKAVCDTYTAQILRDEPAVMFQTKGGDAALQRKAGQLGKFLDGVFYDADLYIRLPQLVLDSCLFPFSAAQVFEDWTEPKKPRVAIDRVMAWEYIADEQDARDGRPKNPYKIRGIDRLVAMATWPDQAADILVKAPSVSDFDPSLFDDDGTGLSDQIIIIEAWHLSSGKGDPGRHVISSGSVILLDEPYTRRTTGIELLYRLPPTTGIWSSVLAEELKGIQREINQLLNKLKHAHQLTASGHWLVEQNSNINVNALDNQQGSVIRYKGIIPQFFPGGTVPAEIYAHLDRLYQRAFEIIGVSMSIAQGQTPQLNGSGKAILAFADVQSQRFKPSYRQLQHFVLRLGREVIGCARRISDKHKSFAVNAPGKLMKTVRWADANLEDEEFVMQPKPVNKLADDPVGVMDQIQNLANAGPQYMSPTAGRNLMTQVPDLEAWASQMNAAYDLTMQMADEMLENGEYTAPDGFLPLDPPDGDGAIKWMHLRLLKAQLDKEPDDRCDLLRRWLVEAEQTDQESKAAKAPQPGLPMGATMGPQPPPNAQPPPQQQAA
jgi:hypothetical protein